MYQEGERGNSGLTALTVPSDDISRFWFFFWNYVDLRQFRNISAPYWPVIQVILYIFN